MAEAALIFCFLISIVLGVGFNLLATKRHAKRWKRVLIVFTGFLLLVLACTGFMLLEISAQGSTEHPLATLVASLFGYAIVITLCTVVYVISTLLTSVGKRVVKNVKARKPLKTN